MPRNPSRKTKIGMFSKETMGRAVDVVLNGGSVRYVVKEKCLNFRTLASDQEEEKWHSDGFSDNYEVEGLKDLKTIPDIEDYVLVEFQLENSRWNKMKKHLRKDPPQTVQELKVKLQGVWDGIWPKSCKELVDTMPDRMNAVFKHKGGITQY
ncbi:hypothetical protein ILUMI_06876 [Ignelater luminosus]|uniref:Uncharacterized protein n=1 Tax=Ignelater luminosus TaxID=2038154 RepID=A0A8K0GHC2_IGNLU|nr:hypothetical protein ILUMI_06876 [Ignelater luminosus]